MGLARAAFTELGSRHKVIIVEGTGGILVPLDRYTLVVDIAAQIGFPVLLVCRAGLGTINHTLLTIRELERNKLTVAGIVMNTTRVEDADIAPGSKEEIERISGKKIVATIPYLGGGTMTELTTRAMAAIIKHVIVRGMLGGEGGVPGANKSGTRPAVL
jgi:dethiobiotin synthetase